MILLIDCQVEGGGGPRRPARISIPLLMILLIDCQVEGGGGPRRPARISIRPLARKDIFYSGSIQALQAS